MKSNRRILLAVSALLAGSVLLGTRAEAQHYSQDDLLSDQPGGVPFTDPNLVNPWGLARSTISGWFSANNRTGTATVHSGGTGESGPLVVSIPPLPGRTGHGSPTAAVFNGTDAFALVAGIPARVMFVTEDGTISGFNLNVDATHAVLKVVSPGASYTGAAIALRGGSAFLYVANFADGRIEVFDSAFNRVQPPALAGAAGSRHPAGNPQGERLPRDHFLDDQVPPDFAPFNVQNVGGDLYVTFAKKDAVTGVAAGPGLGYVDVFSPGGQLLRRLEHGPWLDAPWGIALASGDFGSFSHNLLVGQFGSGEIAAYDAATGAFLGKLLKSTGEEPLVVDGLRALSFGSGLTSSGPANFLFFAAGVDNESHGLFGLLAPVAEEQLLGNGS